MAAIAELIAAEMAGYADPAIQRSVFGVVEPDQIAALLDEWVDRNLGGRIESAWLWAVSVGCVAGLTLHGVGKIVVKAYPATRTRDQLEAVLRLQTAAADRGMPAPTPVAGPAKVGRGMAVAETALDVGRRANLLDPVDRATAAQGWVALSRALEPLASLLADTDLGAGRVVRGLYPTPHSPLFDFEATSRGAEWIDDYARRATDAMQQLVAPLAVVHKDWRGDNIRLSDQGDRLVAIFDWESVRLQHEAVAVGEIAAMHSVDWSPPHDPYFATADECVAFARAIEHARQVDYTTDEWRALQAAILFGWCYTARCEHARASIGDDKPQFGMRRRLAADGGALAATI